jgi:hypothetical protein
VGAFSVWHDSACCAASVVFIAQIIAPERKILAVYPVLFFYTFLSWMVFLQ